MDCRFHPAVGAAEPDEFLQLGGSERTQQTDKKDALQQIAFAGAVAADEDIQPGAGEIERGLRIIAIVVQPEFFYHIVAESFG